MLKQSGFSLFEVLICLMIASLILIGTSQCYQQLQMRLSDDYLKSHLQQTVHQALAGLSKDIKRAGFTHHISTEIKFKPIEINDRQDCIVIRYDSGLGDNGSRKSLYSTYFDVFTFRYHQNNLEYKHAATKCDGLNWQRLFDPNDVNVTQFSIKQRSQTIEIKLTAELKKHAHIQYNLTKIIKNENR